MSQHAAHAVSHAGLWRMLIALAIGLVLWSAAVALYLMLTDGTRGLRAWRQARLDGRLLAAETEWVLKDIARKEHR